MTVLPKKSAEVLVAPLGDIAVAYDLLIEQVHLLNSTAGALLTACDGDTNPDDLAATWADQTGADPATVKRDVHDGIEQLTSSGLLVRATIRPQQPALTGSTAAPPPKHGAVHAVLDHGVQFRGTQQELLDVIDDWLGMAEAGRPVTISIDVDQAADGTVSLLGDTPWHFDSIEGCLSQLPTIINEYAVDCGTCVALHAGAVSSPTGQVVLLPAQSGDGKSTLTAALIAAGWEYLGDEAIGIRPDTLDAVAYPKPLSLDATSRAALGLDPLDAPNTDATELRADVVKITGDHGPLSQVVLPVYRADTERSLVRLEPRDAILALLKHTLNLRRVDQIGLETLCQVAATVPVYTLTHPGIGTAVEVITSLD